VVAVIEVVRSMRSRVGYRHSVVLPVEYLGYEIPEGIFPGVLPALLVVVVGDPVPVRVFLGVDEAGEVEIIDRIGAALAGNGLGRDLPEGIIGIGSHGNVEGVPESCHPVVCRVGIEVGPCLALRISIACQVVVRVVAVRHGPGRRTGIGDRVDPPR